MKLGLSYVSAFYPNHIESDIKEMKAIGTDEVLFAMQENHLLVLDGPLHFGAKIAEDNGITPYAVTWGFANTFGGGRASHFMLKNPDMWRIDESGTPYPMMCINNTKAEKFFMEYTEMIAEKGFKGIFVDEPTKQWCWCPVCREKYAAVYGGELPLSRNHPDYIRFQRDSVVEYTQRLCDKVKNFDNNLKTITCLMPRDSDVYNRVATIDSLDVFGTDPYWLFRRSDPSLNITFKQAVEYTEMAKTAAAENNKESQVWLNCFWIHAGDEEELYTGGKKLAEMGCDSFYTWSYKAGIGNHEVCERPEIAWESVKRIYKEIKDIE